ncbi:hypothetical protein FACS1894124_1840 [Spirochaetia bacterium]|nr:hypothetical protein FACS1894124_1840 [Spirochaetia bacterium]
MKKFFCVIGLAAMVLGTAFAQAEEAAAQSPFSVTVDMAADALFIRTYTGGYAENMLRSAMESPYVYQGEGYTKAFQSSGFDEGLDASVKAAYSGDHLGGLLQLKYRSTQISDTFYPLAVIGDWNAWLKFGDVFKFTAGNTAQRGQVARYANFDDFTKARMDNLGVMAATWQENQFQVNGNNVNSTAEFPYGYTGPGDSKAFVKFTGIDANDLFTPAGTGGRQSLGLLFDFTFAPVTVSASLGGLFENLSLPFKEAWFSAGDGTRLVSYEENGHPPLERKRINAAGRIEGAEIADMVTLAAVYKYAMYSVTKIEVEDPVTTGMTPVDLTVTNQTFGLYANITPLDVLGITVGYTGFYKTWTEPLGYQIDSGREPLFYKDSDLGLLRLEKDEVVFPFYHGIDLRAAYSGIENLTITFNNNVSFASLGSNPDATKYHNSWAYKQYINGGDLPNPNNVKDRKESYLGLYNSLGVKYEVNDRLTVDAQVANQLGLFTLDWEKVQLLSLTDSLGAYLGASFQIVEKAKVRATIHGGVALRLDSYEFQAFNSSAAPIYKAGYLDFGIPLGLKVEF